MVEYILRTVYYEWHTGKQKYSTRVLAGVKVDTNVWSGVTNEKGFSPYLSGESGDSIIGTAISPIEDYTTGTLSSDRKVFTPNINPTDVNIKIPSRINSSYDPKTLIEFIKIQYLQKGKIITCNINSLSCPNCGSAPEGASISVIAEMENVGNETGDFRFYILDQDGNELSREPDFTYKSVKVGEKWKVEKTLVENLNFDMPTQSIVNGKLELRRRV